MTQLPATVAFLVALAAPLPPELDVTDSLRMIDVGRHVSYLEDAKKEWKLDDVRSPRLAGRFRPAGGKIPNHGFTTSAYWYRVRLVNHEASTQRMYLEVPYVILDRIEFFVARSGGGGFDRYLMGDTVPGGGRVLDQPTYVVPLSLAPRESKQLYIRVETEGSLQLPLELWHPDAYVAAVFKRELFFGSIFGLMVALLVYNLFLFAMVRERSYGYFSLCVCGAFVYVSYFTGLAQAYYVAWSPWLANTGYPLAMLVTCIPVYLFTRRFLNLRELMPRLNRVFVGLVIAGLLVFPLSLVASYRTTLMVTIAIAVGGSTVAVLTGVYALYRGYRPARYYVTGWTVFFIGIVIFAVDKAGVMPTNIFTNNIHVLGFMATLLLLPLGLADRINLLRDEKEQAQAEALAVQAKMAARLESEVEVKTVDLQVANEMLAERNEQLRGEIEQREQAEQERVALERRLFQSQKMDAIGRLAGGVAHDMNNILAVISLTAQGVKFDRTEDRALQAALEDILAAARRGGDLAKNLLGFARRGQYRKERLSLNEAIKDINRLLRRTIHQGIEIKMELDPDLHAMEGDPNQLGQILVNLAVNAAHAMSEKGTLTFRTDNFELGTAQAAAEPEGLPAGRYVRLQVRDTGAGMDEETRAQAFEPFFTTKPPGEGTGLGLSMVYGAVEAHGGRVTIDSAPGAGTTVTILLPAIGELAREAERPARSTAEATEVTPGGTVLVVDDEPLLRRSTANMLERLGFRVLLAENGEQAVELFRRERADIAVVLLDMVMPVMGGREAFQALREVDPKVKVVLSSGFSQEGAAEELLGQGAVAFLQKPYEQDDLLAALNKAAA